MSEQQIPTVTRPRARRGLRERSRFVVAPATRAVNPDKLRGWVVDFDEIARQADGIRQALDHRLLNEVVG